jgi:1-aminocyclopropane-1-carboxylate deaminase
MSHINFKNISLDKLSLPLFTEKQVEVSVLRLDKIDPFISGNKWFKLRYYLEDAKKQNKKTIVTFGGAWSNHILATAAACRMNNLNSIGIIRGEEPSKLSPTLVQAKEAGMELIFISREEYQRKTIPEKLNSDEYYFIGEGGYGIKGAEGAATILDYCKKENYTHICCATGTGTMMAGLINGTSASTTVTGISVLKNNFNLEENVKSLLTNTTGRFTITHGYHFGGYAKHQPELIDFMNNFYKETGVPTDFVYTGKLFFAVTDLIKEDYFLPGSRLLVIHSGGLQGNVSLGKATLIF